MLNSCCDENFFNDPYLQNLQNVSTLEVTNVGTIVQQTALSPFRKQDHVFSIYYIAWLSLDVCG
jgi:hypothetical protein